MCSTCGCKGAESFFSECGTKRAESFGAEVTSMPKIVEWDDNDGNVRFTTHETFEENGDKYTLVNDYEASRKRSDELMEAESFEAEDRKIEGYVAVGGDRYANYAYVSTNAEKLKQAFKDSFMETRYDFEEEELEKMWSNFSPKEALEAVGMYLKKVDLSKAIFIYDGDVDALDAESSKTDDDNDDDDELDEEEEYKMLMRENEALQREEENERIVRAIRKDRGDEYYAESFEAPKSPALKNLSTIAVLALAIFVGKKLKE